MLNLIINIDSRSGFCFGVVNAIKKAEEQLEKDSPLYCLGQIVHNDEEVKRLEFKGMHTINKENLSKLGNKNILFRAHGEPPESYNIATNNNNNIIDASCPIILKFHTRIKKSYENGEKIYIYGKRNHPEIIGLLGQINNNAVVFEKVEDLNISKIPKEITLYSQTTHSLENYYSIIEILREKGIIVNVKDTICREVSNRQPELSKFCVGYDRIIFIAGRNSSNGKVLFNFCKKSNPNTYFISSAEEIKKEWFSENEKVGICGATSTPRWLMEKTKELLESW